MLTVEERLRLCHQGTAWMGTLIEKQLRELTDLLAAADAWCTKVEHLTEAEDVMRRNAIEHQAEAEKLRKALAAAERSDAESLAMYRCARDRADRLQREIDEIKQSAPETALQSFDRIWRTLAVPANHMLTPGASPMDNRRVDHYERADGFYAGMSDAGYCKYVGLRIGGKLRWHVSRDHSQPGDELHTVGISREDFLKIKV